MPGRLARMVGGPHDGLELHVLPDAVVLHLRRRGSVSAGEAFGFTLSGVEPPHEYRCSGARCEDGALRFDYREQEQ